MPSSDCIDGGPLSNWGASWVDHFVHQNAALLVSMCCDMAAMLHLLQCKGAHAKIVACALSACTSLTFVISGMVLAIFSYSHIMTLPLLRHPLIKAQVAVTATGTTNGCQILLVTPMTFYQDLSGLLGIIASLRAM